jgi:hypothetical protein
VTEQSYPESVFMVPGIVTVMTPPHAHTQVLGEVSTGRPPISVRVATGIHGPVGFGTQGIGVSTPSAAAVADATVGLASEVHMANGGMLASGTMSAIVAAGLPSITTRLVGMTFNVDGAMPKLHIIIAVAVTLGVPMFLLSLTRSHGHVSAVSL